MLITINANLLCKVHVVLIIFVTLYHSSLCNPAQVLCPLWVVLSHLKERTRKEKETHRESGDSWV